MKYKEICELQDDESKMKDRRKLSLWRSFVDINLSKKKYVGGIKFIGATLIKK
jgi:hypothetical protein